MFTRGALYHLLSNPVYRGAIRHKDRLFENAHPAIIDENLWMAVQAKLAANGPNLPSTRLESAESMLRGILFDDRGAPMRPLHTKKGARRYRYYASASLREGKASARGSLPRIAMGVIETFVVDHAAPVLSRGWRPEDPTETRVRDALVRVTLGEDRIVILVRSEAAAAKPHVAAGAVRVTDEGLEMAISIRLKHRRGAIVIGAGEEADGGQRLDRALVRGVCLARAWVERLASGETPSIMALAKDSGFCKLHAAKLMPLAWLAPDITQAILEGRQPPAVTLTTLFKHPLPLDWAEQRRHFAALG